MKKIVFIGLFALIFFGCGNTPKDQTQSEEKSATEQVPVVYTVDELYSNAATMVDKEVVVKGTVIHVCKESGARCFLMGSSEEINIRIEAGEKIGAFNQEQMGSSIEIVGVLKEVKTEADAHNPGQHEGEGAVEEDATVAEVHKVISESQANAETVYFIEGLKVREL